MQLKYSALQYSKWCTLRSCSC